MSLLLEALKKAELAKQNSLGANALEEPSTGGISFVEPSEPEFRAEPLPELTPPESYLADAAPIERLEPIAPEKPVETATLAAAPVREPAAPRPQTAPTRAAPVEAPAEPPPAPAEVQRSAARQVFEAKEVDYNPRRPFYITIGILGLIGVGYGGYLWWELRPRPTVYANTTKTASSAPPKSASLPPPPPEVATGPSQASASDPANMQATAPAPQAAQTIQAAPDATQPPPKPAPAAANPTATTTTTASTAVASVKPPIQPAPPTPAAPAAADKAGSALPSVRQAIANILPGTTPPPPASSAAPIATVPPRPAAPRPARLPIKVTPPAFQANEVLEGAYAAFQRGEFDKARSAYQLVLARETNNRDALLGLAAIDVRNREFDTAELRYLKLLELDPRDTHAHAALIALQGNVDAVQSESRIKNLIASQPEATHLYFTLGNQYAAQSRWIEAQDAYFKAHSAEPENADYAYNLAVSLDHLRQRQLALDFYRRALSLAGARPVSFERAQVEARVKELGR